MRGDVTLRCVPYQQQKIKDDIKILSLKSYHTTYNLTNASNKYICSIEILGLSTLGLRAVDYKQCNAATHMQMAHNSQFTTTA